MENNDPVTSKNIRSLAGIYVVLLCVASMVLTGYIDYITGEEISLSIFYLMPISFLTWRFNMLAGVITSLVASAEWLFTDFMSGHFYSHPAVGYWNMFVRLGFFLIACVLLARLKKELLYEKELATIDFLTGAKNSRSFFELAGIEINRSKRFKRPFSVAYIDVDDFKTINDKFGHTVGDMLLQLMVGTIKKSVRPYDIVGRLGGDEFAVILPETGYESAKITLERFKRILLDDMKENGLPATFSIGGATFDYPPKSVDEMLRAADELMYIAKKDGKNRIEHKIITPV